MKTALQKTAESNVGVCIVYQDAGTTYMPVYLIDNVYIHYSFYLLSC
jgi:hypothetical protein